VEPPWGVEPQTYALRGRTRAVQPGSRRAGPQVRSEGEPRLNPCGQQRTATRTAHGERLAAASTVRGTQVLAQSRRPSASLPATRTNSRRIEGTHESRSVPVPWLGSLALGPALPPVPLVLAALLVGAVGARVALAPSRSDAEGALAATVETWIILGRGGQLGVITPRPSP
jgi:hypothetical protein